MVDWVREADQLAVRSISERSMQRGPAAGKAQVLCREWWHGWMLVECCLGRGMLGRGCLYLFWTWVLLIWHSCKDCCVPHFNLLDVIDIDIHIRDVFCHFFSPILASIHKHHISPSRGAQARHIFHSLHAYHSTSLLDTHVHSGSWGISGLLHPKPCGKVLSVAWSTGPAWVSWDIHGYRINKTQRPQSHRVVRHAAMQQGPASHECLIPSPNSRAGTSIVNS